MARWSALLVLTAALALLVVGLGSCGGGWACWGSGCGDECCTWVCVVWWCYWECDDYCKGYYETLEPDPFAPPPEEVW